ncbi:MAG: trehalase family glycosidase, partial [Planctomycetota bacterium]
CAREYFDQTGYMMEKYNAVSPELVGAGGEYKPQTGFGWTNAIVMYFQRFLEDHTPELYNRTTAHER